MTRAPVTAPEIPGLVYRQPLGSGGYADVFLYEQQQPRMPVAVKVLKREGLTPAIRRQFVEEADTMAQARGPPLHRPGLPQRAGSPTAAPTW